MWNLTFLVRARVQARSTFPRIAVWGLPLVVSLGVVLCSAAPAGANPRVAPSFLYGPYKHLNTAVDPALPAAMTRVNGVHQALAQQPHSTLLPGANVVALAFASGECGHEHWGGLPGQAVADANIKALSQANLGYIISTGGEGNVFTCTTDAGMEQFIARYESPQLIGLDFDIEAGQSPEMVRALVRRVQVALARRPHLRMSFTLATFAASDASQASLNAQGQLVLDSIRAIKLAPVYYNLMVMNYGPAKPANCVVRDSRCDMAASGAQAARNLHARYAVPMAHIALTAMVGVNDVAENVFTAQDATALAKFVRSNGLGGLHFWSLDRDTPCPKGENGLSPTCSGMVGDTPLAFSRAFAEGLR